MAGKKYMDLIESDCVEYYLFPNLDLSEWSFDAVNTIQDDIYQKANKISENYFWHNEEFRIFPRKFSCFEESDTEKSEAFSFYGSMNYGENIEDEWFLIYLLIELSKQIKGLVIRVKDADGEVLLIEAAEHLPSWITLETCEDMVL